MITVEKFHQRAALWHESPNERPSWTFALVGQVFNPVQSKVWNYVMEQGGAIMARMDSSQAEAVGRHPKAQN